MGHWKLTLAMMMAGVAVVHAAEPATQPATVPAAASVTAPAAIPATQPVAQATTQPGTMPATAPALEPKDVVLIFLVGILNGDEKAIFSNMWFTNDDVRDEAVAVIGEALAQQQLDATLSLAFDKVPDNEPTIEDLKKVRISEVKTRTEAAIVIVTDDRAVVALEPQPKILLVKVNGVWKVDFEKTERENNHAPVDRTAIAETTWRIKVYKELNADIRAAKFRTSKEALDELARRLGLLPVREPLITPELLMTTPGMVPAAKNP